MGGGRTKECFRDSLWSNTTLNEGIGKKFWQNQSASMSKPNVKISNKTDALKLRLQKLHRLLYSTIVYIKLTGSLFCKAAVITID